MSAGPTAESAGGSFNKTITKKLCKTNLLYYLYNLNTKYMSNKIKTEMKFLDGNEIEGRFILPDKTITNFYVDSSGEFEQWGNSLVNQRKTISDLVSLIQLFYYTDL